jgi:hypothetical protein
MKFKLTPTSINSMDIRMISRLRLFIIRPRTPEKKIKVEIKMKISNEKNMLEKN